MSIEHAQRAHRYLGLQRLINFPKVSIAPKAHLFRSLKIRKLDNEHEDWTKKLPANDESAGRRASRYKLLVPPAMKRQITNYSSITTVPHLQKIAALPVTGPAQRPTWSPASRIMA